MLLPRTQHLQCSQQGEHRVFHVLNAHFPQKGGVVVKAASRKVIKLDINKEKDDSDLDEVECGFRVNPRRVLILVQEQDHRQQHVFQAK